MVCLSVCRYTIFDMKHCHERCSFFRVTFFGLHFSGSVIFHFFLSHLKLQTQQYTRKNPQSCKSRTGMYRYACTFVSNREILNKTRAKCSESTYLRQKRKLSFRCYHFHIKSLLGRLTESIFFSRKKCIW